jgi:hypothetical protein
MDENQKRNTDAQNENNKVDKQEKPMKKKRRTLYSIRENTTLFNATNSIFQVHDYFKETFATFSVLFFMGLFIQRTFS